MNRRLLVVTGALLCAIIGSATAFTVRNRAAGRAMSLRSAARTTAPQSTASPAPGGPNQQEIGIRPVVEEVPDYVVYWHLFHHNNFLIQKAQETEALGQDGTAMRNFYRNGASLDDAQTLTFNEIAASCEQDVKAIDDQAKVIIANFRAQHPGGLMQPGTDLPPPPAELQALQQQRNDVILASRDRLQAAFGEAAFGNFQTFVQEKVAPQIRREPLNEMRPARGDEGRQPRGTVNAVQPGMSQRVQPKQ